MIASNPYGWDDIGLICGYAFMPGQPGRALPAAEIEPALETEADGSFVWLHFNLSNTASERWMRRHLGLPEELYESLHGGSRSTRIENIDDTTLLAVLNDVIYNFSLDGGEVSTLWVCASTRLLLTARVTSLRSIDRLRESVKAGARFRSPVALLVHLLDDQANVMAQIVREAIIEVDRAEDSLLAGRPAHKRTTLSSFRRVLVRLRRLLAPEPAALFRLLNRPPEWLIADDIQEFRQATEEFSLVLNDMATLEERIKLLQEEIAGHINEQDNRSLFTLTVVSILALPINIVAGLLGMNVGGIPLQQHPHGFWMVVALIASFTVIAGWLAFRRWRG